MAQHPAGTVVDIAVETEEVVDEAIPHTSSRLCCYWGIGEKVMIKGKEKGGGRHVIHALSG